MGAIKQRTRRSKGIVRGVPIAEGERLYVGIDTHKKDYHCAVWSKDRDALVVSWVGPAQAEALMRRLEPCEGQVARIVYEAGPTGFALARRLAQAGWPAQVVSAAHTPEAPVQEDKCDRLDAKKLAQYASKNLLRAVYVLTEQEEWDREVFRSRDRICRQVRRIKQQTKAFLLFHGLAEPAGLKNWSLEAVAALGSLELAGPLRFGLDELLSDLAYHKTRLLEATGRLKALSLTDRYRESCERLCGPPGVGLIIAIGFLLELPRPERFASGRQVGRILALSPRIRSSGQTRREVGRHRGGQGRLRSLLIEGAWGWRRRDPMAFAQYNRLLANTGSPYKAITALARKLAIILWKMETSKTPYCPGLLNIPAGVFEGMKRKAAKASGRRGARASA